MNAKWVVSMLAVFIVMLVAGGYWSYKQNQTQERLRNSLENQYQLSFREMVDQVENIEVDMAKALVSNSSRQIMLSLTDVWRNANGAQSNLGRLPLSHLVLTRTQQFLTQIGDFSYSVAKTTSPEIQLKTYQRTTLNDLYQQCRYLSGRLHALEMDLDKGTISLSELEEKSNSRMGKASSHLVQTSFRVIEKQMIEYPALTYDGPFSDQLNPVPLGLPAKKISSGQAAEIAKDFAVSGNRNAYSSQVIGEGNGQIPSFSLAIRPNDNGNTAYVAAPERNETVYLDVSKQGGKVVWMVNNRGVKGKKISFSKALQKAQSFLVSKGYENMVLTSYLEASNTMIFSFAYQQDGVVIYPDLVKVKVALDDGQIVGVEAVNYLMSHRRRKLPSPKLSLEQASKKVNPAVKVERVQLALIPSKAHDEILCYEFLVNREKNRFLIYINALNGEEQDILRLIEDKNLLLAM